jgi:hypothetical protein
MRHNTLRKPPEIGSACGSAKAANAPVAPWEWSPSELEIYISALGRKIEALAGYSSEPIRAKGLADWRNYLIAEGRRNGYPECCISFFADTWFPAVIIVPELEWFEIKEAYSILCSISGLEHVPCPRCLRAATDCSISVEHLKKRVEIRRRIKRRRLVRILRKDAA